MEKGPSTVNDMKNQIAYKCSAEGEFETDLVKNSENEKARKRNLTKEIKKWISLKTYGGFIKPVIEHNMTDAEIEEMYSDSIFFLDEAHNLKRGKDTSKKEAEDLKTTYDTMWRIFHVAKRCKFIVGSATPMINDVNELPKMLNLILPLNRQMPLDWDYKKVSFKQMEYFFRGIITFVRGLDTGVVIKDMGKIIERSYEIEVPREDWIAPDYREGQKQPAITPVPSFEL